MPIRDKEKQADLEMNRRRGGSLVSNDDKQNTEI